MGKWGLTSQKSQQLILSRWSYWIYSIGALWRFSHKTWRFPTKTELKSTRPPGIPRSLHGSGSCFAAVPGSTQSPTPCVQRFTRSQIWQDFGVVWSIEQVTIEKVGLKHWSIENLSRLKTKSRIHQKVKISENLWQIDLFWDTSNILIPLQKNTDPSEIAMRSSLTNRAPKLDLIHSTTGPIWSGSMSIGWDFHVLTMERLTWFLDAYTAFHSRFGYIYIYTQWYIVKPHWILAIFPIDTAILAVYPLSDRP